VWGALTYSTGASTAILLAGMLFLLAADRLTWQHYRFCVVGASIPWLVVGVLLVLASLRYSLGLLERLTGVDLNRSGDVGDIPDVRIVPYRGPSHTVDGIVPDDLRYFVHTICSTSDWTQATWRRVRMPSGKRCNTDYHTAMCETLRKTGVIVNAGPRASGNLTTTDPVEILDLLGLTD